MKTKLTVLIISGLVAIAPLGFAHGGGGDGHGGGGHFGGGFGGHAFSRGHPFGYSHSGAYFGSRYTGRSYHHPAVHYYYGGLHSPFYGYGWGYYRWSIGYPYYDGYPYYGYSYTNPYYYYYGYPRYSYAVRGYHARPATSHVTRSHHQHR